jgi:addiction module HigA family antidote
MIKSWAHKGLKELFERGRSKKIDPKHVRKQYAVSVSGNWRLIFEFDGADVTNVDYDDYHWKDLSMSKRTRRPSHPGAVLMINYKEPLGLKVVELADALGLTPKHVSNLLHERASVTTDTAVRLAVALKTTPQMWLNLQANYDLWATQRDTSITRRVKCLVAWAAADARPQAEGGLRM